MVEHLDTPIAHDDRGDARTATKEVARARGRRGIAQEPHLFESTA